MMQRLIGDRVLVALPPKDEAQDASTGYTYQQEQTTASGLILAAPADAYNMEVATRGLVVQVGEKRGLVDLEEVRSEVHTWFVDTCQRPTLNPLSGGPLFRAMDGQDLSVTVRAIGDTVDRILMAMRPAPFDVHVGEVVIFAPSAGDQFEQDGVQYVILREADVLGVLEFKKEAA